MDRKLEEKNIDAVISLLKGLHFELMAHRAVILHFEGEGIPLEQAVEKARHNVEIRKAVEKHWDNCREKLFGQLEEAERESLFQRLVAQWSPTSPVH
jgi:hypothetical protein